MPRRKLPIKKFTGSIVEASDHAALDAAVNDIVGREHELARLPTDKRDPLINALVDAVGFARVGLAELLAGKRAKPKAWTLDILTKDVCGALERAGVPALTELRSADSLTQRVAGELAKLAGIQDCGELYHQMLRATDIVRGGGATATRKPILVLGRWQVPD